MKKLLIIVLLSPSFLLVWCFNSEKTEVKTQENIQTWAIQKIQTGTEINSWIININNSTWKTYTDTEKWFEFEYPETCKISSDPMVWWIHLSIDIEHSSDNCNLNVVYYDNIDSISLWVPTPRNNIYDFIKDPDLSNTLKTSFLWNDALTGIFENKNISLKEKEIYISHNNHLYNLSYTISYGDKIFKKTIPEKIISTFKFTK